MAKKKRFSFSDIGKMVKDNAKKTGTIIEDNNAKVTHGFIGTGIYLLNGLISKSILNGGVPNNRITVFAGESGVGKSFLCYNIAREAQQKGYSILYIDTEHSIEMDQLHQFGIDTSDEKFILMRTNVVEDLKIQLAQLINALKEQKNSGVNVDKFMIILDSAGQLASRKEVDDALSGKEKADMTRAKSIGSMLRIINSDLGFLEVPMIITNHTYESMDLFPQAIMKGGKSLYYTPSTIIMLTKAKLKTGKEDDMDLNASGIILTAKAFKNRMAKPKKIKFELSWEEGANPFKGLEVFCRPETYDEVGIVKGKIEVDKETGEEKVVEKGNRWYIRHLDRSIFTKDLHTPEVFTQDVLNALDGIISKYFSYKSFDEQQQGFQDADELHQEKEDDDVFKEVDEIEEIV